MHDPLDRRLTLDALDPPAWGPPTYPSSLVQTCHRLRQVPLDEFTPGDLRIMIGQDIGLQWLIPLALDVLEKDPLVEGTFYEGDLLVTVLQVESEFWATASPLQARLDSLLRPLEGLDEDIREAIAHYTDAGQN